MYANDTKDRWHGNRATLSLRQLSKMQGNDIDFGANFECDMTPGPLSDEHVVASIEPMNRPFRHAETSRDPAPGK